VNCVQCTTPTGYSELFLCKVCDVQLERWFGALIGHARDLEEVVVTRLTSHRGERVMVRSSQEFPMPYDATASEAAVELRFDLRWLVGQASTGHTRYHGPEESASMARWLSRHTKSIAMNPDARAIYATVKYRHDATVGAVNIPAARVLLGPCGGCGADVRAEEEATEVTCPGCLRVYGVQEFKDSVRERMRGGLATLPELAVLFKGQVRRNLLHVWCNRGRMRPALSDDEVTLYRIGDVIDLIGASKRP
jgi:hypothetical protein